MTESELLPKRKSKLAILVDLLAGGILLAAIVATVVGFAGRNDWRFDLCSHFRIQYAIVCLPAALWFALRRKPVMFFLGLTGFVVNAWLVSPLLLQPATPTPTAVAKADGDTDSNEDEEAATDDDSEPIAIRILMSNVYAGNSQTAALLAQIETEDPDVVIIEEYTAEWGEALKALEEDYPHTIKEDNEGAFGIALYSKLRIDGQVWTPPMAPGLTSTPTIITKIGSDGKTATLIATHPVPPTSEAYSQSRNEQLIAIGTLIGATDGEIVLCGDLNMTRWSSWFGELTSTGLRDGSEGFGLQTTWPVRYNGLPPASVFRIPIDHCLVSKKVKVTDFRSGKDVGSDHLPIIIDLEL